MPQASLDALLTAYREQALWLLAQAAEFETGHRKIMAGDIDLSAQTAEEYRHKAGNLWPRLKPKILHNLAVCSPCAGMFVLCQAEFPPQRKTQVFGRLSC
jgi:hypothetical protein